MVTLADGPLWVLPRHPPEETDELDAVLCPPSQDVLQIVEQGCLREGLQQGTPSSPRALVEELGILVHVSNLHRLYSSLDVCEDLDGGCIEALGCSHIQR